MIKINNLEKQYDDYRLNISMDIPEGCITGLVGKNGAGKSTTIKAILGLIKMDGGQAEVLGKDVSRLTPADREKMGIALSDSGFSAYLNIEDVIKIMKEMYHDFDEKWFREKCREQGLPTKKQIKGFSTGMKAKLKVLAALSHRAKLLILDEPTSGLDVEARNDILDMLREYVAEDDRCSVLITSHIATDLENLCDDIYMIHKGKMILHEDTDVILSRYAVLKVDNDSYDRLDQNYILSVKKTAFGYECLTKEKQFYQENYPDMVIERCGIDQLILMMTGGK